MKISIKQLKEIAALSKKSISELRKMNPERCYYSNKLTKFQLIFQIVFNLDAPDL